MLSNEQLKAFNSFFSRGCELALSPYSVDASALSFQNALRIRPDDANTHFALGKMYYSWWRSSDAYEPLRKAAELNPTPLTLIYYGVNCNHIGKYREAERALKNVVEAVPESQEAHYQLALALMGDCSHDRVRMRRSVDHFYESLALRPDHEWSVEFIGEILVLYLGAFDEARSFIKRIESRFPDNARHIRFLLQLNERAYIRLTSF